MAADNNLLKEQAQQRRLQQAKLPASQTKAAAANKPLFGPPVQVFYQPVWVVCDVYMYIAAHVLCPENS